MNRRFIFALFTSVAAAFLGGCSGSGTPARMPPTSNQNFSDSAPPPGSSGYQQLYAFAGGKDGAAPRAGLIEVNTALYGTTQLGGGTICQYFFGCGSVFKVSITGTERVLHGFTKSDGAYPVTRLLNVNGTLYGTTSEGGAKNGGTVFKLSTSGTAQTIRTFNGPNGWFPAGDLTELNGVLYGTTFTGGDKSCMVRGSKTCGTVFGLSVAGKKRLSYAFGRGSNSHDAARPYAGLVALNGELFGTTTFGGAHGKGTVFAIAPSGKERVVYSFHGSDGFYPAAPLVVVQGKLYGTTESGGATYNGAVFEVSPSGKEQTLYSFRGGRDGASPEDGLVYIKGALYGTTYAGGGAGCYFYGGDSPGCGTIFKITTTGAKTILYRFKGGEDGEGPTAALIAVDRTLYGTTVAGGSGNCPFYVATYYTGCGTVFKISP